MNKIIQCIPRLLAFLLAGCVFSASAYSLVVGNDVPGSGRDKWKSTGPNADQYYNHTNTFGKTVAVHKETGLREVAVYDWTGLIDTGMVYCYKNDGTGKYDIQVFHNYIAAGKNANGHDLWKTSINGLYFVIEITGLYSAGVSTQSLPIWIDQATATGKKTKLEYTGGGSACNYDSVYYRLGGFGVGFKIHLYADQTFAPTAQEAANFELSKNGGHGAVDFYFHNDGSNQSHSKKINITIPATGMLLAWPTCSASTISGVSGTSVTNGNKVQLGNYLPKSIKDGLAPAKFNINMSQCSYIHNIEVKLTSGKIGTNDKQLLANLETSNAASGVGVLIEGLKSNASAQMVIKPNDANSVYKDIMNDPYNESEAGIDNKTLSFQATLKQDGTADIKPGIFRATGTFQITYP